MEVSDAKRLEGRRRTKGEAEATARRRHAGLRRAERSPGAKGMSPAAKREAFASLTQVGASARDGTRKKIVEAGYGRAERRVDRHRH